MRGAVAAVGRVVRVVFVMCGSKTAGARDDAGAVACALACLSPRVSPRCVRVAASRCVRVASFCPSNLHRSNNAKMVQRKERTLLVDVQSLDAEPSPPAAAALFAELRAAVERAGGDPSKVATRNYSREARICAVRTPLALSRMARTAIGTVKYVKGRCACCCGMHCERARAAFFC